MGRHSAHGAELHMYVCKDRAGDYVDEGYDKHDLAAAQAFAKKNSLALYIETWTLTDIGLLSDDTVEEAVARGEIKDLRNTA